MDRVSVIDLVLNVLISCQISVGIGFPLSPEGWVGKIDQRYPTVLKCSVYERNKIPEGHDVSTPRWIFHLKLSYTLRRCPRCQQDVLCNLMQVSSQTLCDCLRNQEVVAAFSILAVLSPNVSFTKKTLWNSFDGTDHW